MDKKQNRETHISFILVGTGELKPSAPRMVRGQQDTNEGSRGVCPGARGCALRGLEEQMTLAFQRCVIFDTKRQSAGSRKVYLDFCQGSYSPRM